MNGIYQRGFGRERTIWREREREREMSVSSNPRFFFLVKDKVRKRGLYFCFSLCGRKEGRKGGCTADTRFCVQSASNLIRLFLGTLLTRRSFLILFDCFSLSLSLSLSLYIYIYDPPLNSFFVCLFVGSPFLLALPFREETLGCSQVRAKIWCPHILGSVEVQYRNISGMPEQSTWVFTMCF
jgi:hypothetical protein